MSGEIDPISSADDCCVRCDYDLRGVANEQPCPECGLLAERSRRLTERLRDSTPRYLRRLSIAVILLLVSITLPILWPVTIYNVDAIRHLSYRFSDIALAGYDAGALMLLLAALLLRSQEKANPLPPGPRRWRWLYLYAALSPCLAMLFVHLDLSRFSGSSWFATVLAAYPEYRRAVQDFDEQYWQFLQPFVFLILLAGCALLPMLLFSRLRRLAKRLLSHHMAEHSLIVGAGVSATILLVVAVDLLSKNFVEWGFGDNWFGRSPVVLIILVVMLTGTLLFWGWAIYLLIRFAIAFWRESRAMQVAWREADRSDGRG